jgi:DNA-binding NtrC family response regulator
MSGFSICLEREEASVQESPALLMVVSNEVEDQHSVRSVLNPAWELYGAGGVGEALSLMRRHRPRVVICERTLPDGDWHDVFADLQNQPYSPAFIVASRHADERLWAEVLNLGAYDVLLKPFDNAEVARVVEMAAFHSNRLPL